MSKHRNQPGFFDVADRLAKLGEKDGPLVRLNTLVDWAAFRADLLRVHEKKRKSNAGAKPFDVVLMFKVLVLQQLHNLSDDGIEYQIRDRLRDRFSFMQFLGLALEDCVPDAKTVWLFRERIKELGLMEELFSRCHEQLARHGYVAKAGQMIDATFVEVPRQRNTREENKQIKAGETPEDWQTPGAAAKMRQKDVDARWTKKNNETHYGYKNHINADEANKRVQSYAVTDASVHDSQVFEELLDQTEDHNGDKRAVYADSAYRSEEKEAQLAEERIPSQICEKGKRNHPLTEEQKAANHLKSKVRVRVEHIFAAQAQIGGHVVRTVGKLRAAVKIGLMNLVYNMARLGQLMKRDRRWHGRGAPAMA